MPLIKKNNKMQSGFNFMIKGIFKAKRILTVKNFFINNVSCLF